MEATLAIVFLSTSALSWKIKNYGVARILRAIARELLAQADGIDAKKAAVAASRERFSL